MGMPATRPRKITVELDVPARMRDGVALRANVYRPEGPGPWPALLNRTPYGKDEIAATSWPGLDPVQAASQGFIVAVQDTRGRFGSDGDWEAYRTEACDGFDSVEWLAGLQACNGRVGMYGGSYHGNNQWLAAARRPPSLAAIAPSQTWSDPADGLLSRGGAVELGVALRWALENGYDSLRRSEPDTRELARRASALMDEWDRLSEAGYWELPVAGSAVLKRHNVSDLGAIPALDDPGIGDRCRVTGLYGSIAVPSFHTAGWYDIFTQGTLDNYQAMVAAGHEARLVVGPWTHLAFGDPIGQRFFGMRAGRDGTAVHAGHDLVGLQLAWFRRHLLPAPEQELPAAPVRIFVMGRNEWRDETGWPPARAVRQQWFLHSDHSLRPTAERGDDTPASEFTYDPADPAPTLGGNGVLRPGYPGGPVDQSTVESRDDVLVYTSEPLREDLEVTGRVTAVLHAASSASSTDWVVRLCDVDPEGRSLNLCDGIVRVAAGADRLQRHVIDLWSTSNVFLRGHRIRVQVTSSSFPRWDRNLNTGDQRGTRYQAARQQFSHRASQPTYVELPVIPAAIRSAVAPANQVGNGGG